jgi:hypothetical protein
MQSIIDQLAIPPPYSAAQNMDDAYEIVVLLMNKTIIITIVESPFAIDNLQPLLSDHDAKAQHRITASLHRRIVQPPWFPS